MADNTMPGATGNPDTDLRKEIEALYQSIVAFKSDIYKNMAMSVGDDTIVKIFSVGFYPKWISFYDITQLGFDDKYKEQHNDFYPLRERAKYEIESYSVKPSIKLVKGIMKTFDEYTEHVKNRTMIKVRS